eukprot:1730089-Rhodomonas_salina.1
MWWAEGGIRVLAGRVTGANGGRGRWDADEQRFGLLQRVETRGALAWEHLQVVDAQDGLEPR